MFDCKDIGIRKSEFVTKNQFLCNKYKNKKYPICKKKSEIKDKHSPNLQFLLNISDFLIRDTIDFCFRDMATLYQLIDFQRS